MKKNVVIISVASVVVIIIIVIIIIKIIRKMEVPKYPVTGKITSKFGYRIHPITKEKKFHNGIDISAQIGTPIIAPISGKVLKVSYNDIGGNQLVIEADNKYLIGFAHLKASSPLKIGDKFKQGDKLGEVGNTGRSTGAHLHLNIRNEKGEFIDPEKIFIS